MLWLSNMFNSSFWLKYIQTLKPKYKKKKRDKIPTKITTLIRTEFLQTNPTTVYLQGIVLGRRRRRRRRRPNLYLFGMFFIITVVRVSLQLDSVEASSLIRKRESNFFPCLLFLALMFLGTGCCCCWVSGDDGAAAGEAWAVELWFFLGNLFVFFSSFPLHSEADAILRSTDDKEPEVVTILFPVDFLMANWGWGA